MFGDLKYALRFLARQRAFAAIAILTVALGVGANTAIFSLADAVLFRPLPYASSDRLYALEPMAILSGKHYGTVAIGDLQAARASGLFDAVMDLDQIQAAFPREAGDLRSLRLQPVPAEYLGVLGVGPLYGRDFDATDAGERAVLLTYRAWMGRYGGNAAMVDASIRTVDGPPLHVVGILPPEFRAASDTVFFSQPDALVIRPVATASSGRTAPPIVRLRADVSREIAEARLTALRGEEISPGKLELHLVPLREVMGRASSQTLWLLCGAAVLVLLVGCVNLANLVLARGAERERELAVRAALGAARWRLVRLLLVENLAIAAIGGSVGLAFAYWTFGMLVGNLPASLARSLDPSLDRRTLAFAIIVTVAAGVVSGLAPAWRLARVHARSGLWLGRLTLYSGRSGRKALLSLEVGVAAVSVIAAVLLGRSLVHLVTERLGFDEDRIILSSGALGTSAPRAPAARAGAFLEQYEAIRALPGVQSVAALTGLPASGQAPDRLLFADRSRSGGVWMVSSGFFRTMGIAVVQGRELNADESFDDAPVGIVNQSAARILFPDGQAIGRQVTAPGQPSRTIVGVVADWRRSFKDPAVPAFYVPFDRAKFRSAQMVVQIDDSPAMRQRLRATILRVAPDSSVDVGSISALLDRDVAPLRFTLLVIGLFAALTLLLAVLGVYGVITFIATERTREYGVRIALGATRQAIARLVVRQAVVPIVWGLCAGGVAAIWTSRLLTSQLYGVTAADGATFTATVLILLASGLAAAAIPARRATRVDPMVALRAE